MRFCQKVRQSVAGVGGSGPDRASPPSRPAHSPLSLAQCNVFEALAEFDGAKRTCRARLEEHNRCQRRLRSLYLHSLAACRSADELDPKATAAAAGEPAGSAADGAAAGQAPSDARAWAEPLSQPGPGAPMFAYVGEGQCQGLDGHDSSAGASSALEALPDVTLAARVGSTTHDELLELGEMVIAWLDSGEPGFPGDDGVTLPSALPGVSWDEPAMMGRTV